MMYDAAYRKPLQLAGAAAMALRVLAQLVCVFVFKEPALTLWSGALMLLEAGVVAVLLRGQRDFLTALPFVLMTLLETILFFSANDAAMRFTAFHLLSVILMAALFAISMVGKVPEMRAKILLLFFLLLACWGYDIFLALNKLKPGEVLTLTTVLDQFVLPVGYGLAAAWAAFPKMFHTLSDEEVEEKLEQYKDLLMTGMLSKKEYDTMARRLVKMQKK